VVGVHHLEQVKLLALERRRLPLVGEVADSGLRCRKGGTSHRSPLVNCRQEGIAIVANAAMAAGRTDGDEAGRAAVLRAKAVQPTRVRRWPGQGNSSGVRSFPEERHLGHRLRHYQLRLPPRRNDYNNFSPKQRRRHPPRRDTHRGNPRRIVSRLSYFP
jgi:hypothetical protein